MLGIRIREGQEGRITKGQDETLGGEGYVHYLDCCKGFIVEYIYQSISTIHFNMSSLLYVNYTAKRVKKKHDCKSHNPVGALF